MPCRSELQDSSYQPTSSRVASYRLLDNRADRRTLFCSLLLFPAMLFASVFSPRFALFLVPLALYFGFLAGVLAHYHTHRGVFRSTLLNRIYSMWLSVFYGFPLFAWIPTHNQNHHKYQNGPLDATRTSRAGRGDHLLTLLLYPSRSGAWQLPSVLAYLGSLRRKQSARFAWAAAQMLALVGVHAGVLCLSVARNGWFWGGVGYGALVGLPAIWASWSMMFVNYIQHVGCNAESANDHSRNFVGSWENWLVFDAGLHTVHHENPGVHWSEYRRLHAARSSEIASELCERNIPQFVWRRYLSPLGRR